MNQSNNLRDMHPDHKHWPKDIEGLKRIAARIERIKEESNYPLSIMSLGRLLSEVREEIKKLEDLECCEEDWFIL